MGLILRNWENLPESALRTEMERIRSAGFFHVLHLSDSHSKDIPFGARSRSLGGLQRAASEAGISLEPFPDNSANPTCSSAFTKTDFARSVYMASRRLFDLNENSRFSVSHNSPGFYRSCDAAPLSLNPGRMIRMALALLSAGALKIDLLRWNPIRRNPIADEYEALDLLGEITPQAQTAGEISLAIRKYEAELSESSTPLQVQILLPSRPMKRAFFSPQSRNSESQNTPGTEVDAGAKEVASALMSRNLSWEFVAEANFNRKGATAPPLLYIPEGATLSVSLLYRLQEFVESGGRVVLELPTSSMDDCGNYLDTRPGSPFEKLFGVSVRNVLQESETPITELGVPIGLPVAELFCSSSEVRRRFSNGFSGVTEKRTGAGSACLIAYPLSKRMTESEDWRYRVRMLTCLEDPSKLSPLPEWQCTECLAFRRETAVADHYFLLNDLTVEQSCMLHFGRNYSEALNAMSGELAPLDRRSLKIVVPALSGVWLRLTRSQDAPSALPIEIRKPISEMTFSETPFTSNHETSD